MFLTQLHNSGFQQNNHLASYLDQKERRLPFFLLFYLMSMVVTLGLSGCALFLEQPAVEKIVYLGWDDAGREQLFLLNADEEPRQLTSFAGAVHDYAPSPDGRHIALSVSGENGDTVLWRIEEDGSSPTVVHTCSQAECSNISWAPDSRRLLFERRDLGSEGIAETPVLWWLDTQAAAVLPVHEDDGQYGAFGRLSADGQWLSYHSPQKEGLFIYNLVDGRSHFITNEIGTAAAWHPDGQQLVLPQLDLLILHGEEGDDHQAHEHDYRSAVHLLRVDVNSGEQYIASGDMRVEDSVPTWSPDGQWIAFGRRVPAAGAARQLWLMRADGSEARALTDDPATNHGPPTWSADGRTLLFQQIPQDDLKSDPAIWQIDVETGVKEELVPSGMQPAWLPLSG